MIYLKKIIVAGVLSSTVLFSILSCEKTNSTCGGSGPILSEYGVSSYSMVFGSFVADETIVGESVQEYSVGEIIDPSNFSIKLESVIDWSPDKASASSVLRFSWIENAYACSPVSYKIPVQRIVNYSITSTGSFGEAYPSGEDISLLFLEYSLSAPSSNRISEYVKGGITDDEIPPIRKTLRLDEVPEESDHVFTFTIELDDGSRYEFISPTISFILG